MNTELETIETLGRIERQFAGPSTAGEQDTEQATRERIESMRRLAEAREGSVEMRFSISDAPTMKLFLALCLRYGLRPYQRHGQHRTTVLLKIPPSFSRSILVPEFAQLAEALAILLRDTTERIIQKSVFRDNGELGEKEAMTG